ncbi:MAG: RsmF rRNA methyltransferase first C-terminal domain-containing protein [Clostridia bacterium]|nr:RsmF rRNA methyltransferase first C-terminal domain-containing protein [Clostridia bacterium]
MTREIPGAFLARMRELLGSDFEAFERALQDEPRRGLRVNPLKIAPADFAAASPFALEPSPLCPEGFFIDTDAPAGKHAFHAAGLYYLQEPSAQSAVTALDPKPGMRVLDLCAAPGGKSGHAAGRLSGDGFLLSNECVGSRARILGYNLERLGVRNAAVSCLMPDVLAAACGSAFDAVIVDAPCSGEGMFRREEAALTEWSEAHALSCAQRQLHILDDAAKMCAPGGTLLYSTCTLNPEENEGAAESFMQAHPEFDVEEITTVQLPAGRPEWCGARETLRHAGRLMFYNAPGEGHFVVKLRKSADGPEYAPQTQPGKGKPRLRALDKNEMKFFREMFADCFDAEPFYEPLVRDDTVWLTPPEAINLPGCLLPGVCAGELKKGRFEPSHTLFMAMRGDEIRRKLVLDPEDELLERFFRGEEIPCGEKGFTAVCVRAGDGVYPVGFGKASGGVLKNRFPKGLRLV